ncbi:MAG: FkbM family methyltransferase [Dysgonamonadaceae bacterium]|nr:FkbM family methyltransferase [Dysgonamonadaceae bacterium]
MYIFRKWLPDTPENQLFAFLGKNGFSPYPYPFRLKYKKLPVDCFQDKSLGMCYVIHSGKRLYFPDNYRKKRAVASYRFLSMEQDAASPHQYIKDINRLKGKTLLDLGAAEGMFTLSVIDIINHAYLFECEEYWIKALNATFAPWKDKVTLVPKYVSDKNDEDNITIDRFLEGKDTTNLFLKMDIEGYEQAALRGAEKTFKEAKDIDFSICTYHREEDAIEIGNYLKANHLETEHTEGFMYMGNSFRKAIIRRKYS